jgi:hypothetical protein
MSLELIYAYWNPLPVMGCAVIVSAVLFALLWLLRQLGRTIHMQPFNRADSFYGFVSRLFSLLTPPVAGAFWSRLAAVTMVCADRTRRLYTGDGQTYNLYILYYFLLLYAAGGGTRYFWLPDY